MAGLPYEEMIAAHLTAKPFSLDPFNEVGIPAKERDALLVRDFIASYEALSHSVSEDIGQRYYNMGREF